MPIGPARMPLFDHLSEFRRRLTIVVVSLIAAAIVVYFATPTLISIMLDPIRSVLPEGSQLTVLSALGGFTIRFKVALFFGAIVCTPIILWEVLGFFLPALTEKERKWVLPTIAAMVALFFLGMVFCYLVIQKAAFGWLVEQITQFATATVNAEDYLSIMMLLEVGFGIAFQLPLIIFYLSILHVVPYRTFRGQWRYVYVGLLVLCGVVTPDASPITMVLMYAVMLALYEISLAVARRVIILRDGKEALNWTREQYAERALKDD
ncbi:MAG: twin-arginine translocase subunit TatC [Atopobiaceae bacterium]|nr:twin-arginine translocase subunit TatC [Atopobiaceae bacterium]